MTEYHKKISRSINMIFPIKAMIFDADGVLLDSLSVWKELGKRYITDLGYQPVAGMDEILFPMSMEQGAAWLKSRFTLEYSEEKIVMDLKARIRKYYFEEVPAKSGARELLQCLAEQKIPAAVATSSPREHICRALERNGLLSFFDKIYTTSEIGESKHSPRVYLTAAEALGTELSRTLVVEDSLYALQTAGNAGFLTAGIYDALGEPDQEQLKKDAYIYCRDLTELQNYIFAENGGNQR
jgi:HAD superfamily hydrolase (TIGR01509 family)